MQETLRFAKRETKLIMRNIRDSIRFYLRGKRRLPHSISRIVFVCKGNICRSAFAEYLMRAHDKTASLDIDSCGLDAGGNASAPAEAITIARKFGLHMGGHLSQRWECCDLENADLILAMEYWQYRELMEYFPNKRQNIRLLREFAPFPENLFCNINDPFGGSEERFDKCFRQIERSLKNLHVILQVPNIDTQ